MVKLRHYLDYQDYYNTMSKSNVSISRQDIDSNDGNHMYFFSQRNWSNAGTTHHHHANYSIEYDIFYLDRSDDTLHSVCYAKRFSVPGEDTISNSQPAIEIRSFEIAGDKILLFGGEHQTHEIFSEQKNYNKC